MPTEANHQFDDPIQANQRRAQTGQKILDAYALTSGLTHPQERDSALGDLLADLRHHAHVTDLDFEAAIRISETHLLEELDEADPESEA